MKYINLFRGDMNDPSSLSLMYKCQDWFEVETIIREDCGLYVEDCWNSEMQVEVSDLVFKLRKQLVDDNEPAVSSSIELFDEIKATYTVTFTNGDFPCLGIDDIAVSVIDKIRLSRDETKVAFVECDLNITENSMDYVEWHLEDLGWEMEKIAEPWVFLFKKKGI